MGERLKSGGDCVKEGTVVVHAEDFLSNFVRGFGALADKIANLFSAIVVMLDQLTGAGAVIREHRAVGRQHQRDLKRMHLLL